MRYSKEFIDDLKYRNPIENVISSYVSLKRAGSNMNGLCPFHSEKTPSFTVFPGTQTFFCFGCGAGGDVFSFLMRAERLEYPDAVALLAKRSGVDLPVSADPQDEQGVSRSRILAMNTEAARFYHKCLLDETLGAPGREYLLEKRKLSTVTVKHFGLGYAPNGFPVLRDHLRSLGYTDDELVAAFLCGRSRETGRLYDYFHGRVIFPIIDTAGNVVAFGGRVLDDSKPKYLNTSDTPAFKKSKNLFALNFAKNDCDERMILCEGYMDVVSLHEAGFPFAVATLGTAITPEHARIFARYTKKVIISYDSDEAGQKAANRAFELLSEVGLDTKVLRVTGAKDPDEFIKKFGAQKFSELLNASKTRFEYEMMRVEGKYDIKDPSERIKAVRDISSFIATVSSPVERDIYISECVKKFSVPADVLRNDIERTIATRKKDEKKKELAEVYRAASGVGDRINPEAYENRRAAGIEEAIIGLLLLRTECFAIAKTEELSPGDFVTEFHRKVYDSMMQIYDELGGFELSYLQDTFGQEEISRLVRMQVNRKQLSANDDDVFRDLIRSLKEESGRGERKSDGVDGILDILQRKSKKV